jgi:putative ABC transport system permease protein
MVTSEIFLVAVSSIRANKLRSFLTMLGIVIGVGAVITVVAMGTGAQKAVADQLDQLGTNQLNVYAGQSFSRGVASRDRVSLTIDDSDALVAGTTTLSAVVPQIQSSMQLKIGNKNASTNVVGTTPNYAELNSYDIVHGRMFSAGDDNSRRRVVVIGSSVPDMFQSNPAAMVGQTMAIRGINFEIVGVLSEKGAQGWSNPDEQVLIPLQTAQHRIFGSDRLRSITVEVAESSTMDLAMIDMERVLRREHGILPGGANDFQFRNFTQFLSAAEETTKTFTFLLSGIAMVSLLVGGIGIMNIMLVSVTERTKEIGVRKAMGATRGNILLQFLVEAVTLCMFGGIIGIIAGITGAVALARLADWNTLIAPSSVFVAFGFSALIGITFGIWPARRAAMLDPIDALRYE